MHNRLERTRISQLTSTYGPDEPPRLPMDFGDYLSLIWRLDKHRDDPAKVQYYRQCALALAEGLGLKGRSVFRLVELTPPGELYEQLPNAPYRGTSRLVDAQDRKAAIAQLAQLRLDILRIGTYHDSWPVSWPGSGIIDTDLRERVFAVLFTALQGQYENFGRLLLVVDIVLGDLLLGMHQTQEISLHELISKFRYPNFADPKIRGAYYSGV
ncbi:MAG TPA: hypothetical protein VHO69_08105 [Phototrophicaceae bacterium]|nr:hypothetical protein [Phototrophicaceae bacterium]